MKGIVINFHREEDSAVFEKKLLALKKRFRLVSLEELEAMLSLGSKTRNICHISFDDGERSFFNHVFPVLQKHQVPASLFVSPEISVTQKNFWFQEIEHYDEKILLAVIASVTGVPKRSLSHFSAADILKALDLDTIRKVMDAYHKKTGTASMAFQNMTLAEIKIVKDSGLVTIGAHTLNHPILQNEDDERSREEIRGSVEELSHLIGEPVKYFAYPNGRPGIDFSEREVTHVKEAAVMLAFSTAPGLLSGKTDKMMVPRMSFATMGLAAGNPLIYWRLSLGRRWINIKRLHKPSEKSLRLKIRRLLGKTA